MNDNFIHTILSGEPVNIEEILTVFRFQYHNNAVYRQWCDCLKTDVSSVTSIGQIPFLPISFFKTHKVVCSDFVPELVFESSGTTQTVNSKHYVRFADIYKESFIKCFETFYGNISDYTILGLLPNYLERGNSSLVYMVNELIRLSGKKESGFYLYEFEQLRNVLNEAEAKKQKTILFGVTFALLDFSEQFPMNLKNTIVMDTGGMKGRKKEMTREEVHEILKKNLGIDNAHSEYGMTELLSQAYSQSNGKYKCPSWMKVAVRDENDPLQVSETGKGLLNIIDLANVYGCSFIATDDVSNIEPDYFEIFGRLDNSDLRGCSLLTV